MPNVDSSDAKIYPETRLREFNHHILLDPWKIPIGLNQNRIDSCINKGDTDKTHALTTRETLILW